MKRAKHILTWLLAKRIRVVGLVALMGVSGFLLFTGRAHDPERVTPQTATVEKGSIVSSVSASGSAVASNLFEVTTKASGIVKEVLVKDGDAVYKGQKIATIEFDFAGQAQNTSAYAAYVSAQNAVNSANSAYRSSQASLAVVYEEVRGHDSDETLAMKESRTKAEVANDNAYDGLKAAELKLAAASLDYQANASTIVASQSGTVNNLTIVSGLKLSGDSTRVATINRPGKPVVSVNVAEIDVQSIKVGQKATVTFDSLPEETYTGTVSSVDKLGSSTNGVTSYPVLILLDTEVSKILTNMMAVANIIVESKTNVLLTPSSALTETNGQYMVTILRDGEQTTTQVTTGLTSTTQTEIVSGLTEGDTIITGGTSAGENVTFGNSSAFGASLGGGSVRMMPR